MGIKLVEKCLSICDDLAEEARLIADPCNPVALQRLIDSLCGLEGLDYDDLRDRFSGVELPGDFRHVLITNLTTGMHWAGCFNAQQEKLLLDDVLLAMACSLDDDDATPQGRGVWSETVLLSVKNPGVLELGVRIRPLH